MCQINPLTSDEATGSVDEGSAADTISLTFSRLLDTVLHHGSQKGMEKTHEKVAGLIVSRQQ